MILFAYAGNMNVAEFAANVPSAHKIANAFLPGYCFTFNKDGEDLSSKANIMPSDSPGSLLWGVLIEIDDNEKELFFNAETWSADFELIPVKCTGYDGQEYDAEAFQSKPHATNDSLLPYDWYVERLVKISELNELPDEYIQALSNMVSKPDPDVERARKRRAKTERIVKEWSN